MTYHRFLVYSLQTNRPVRILLSEERMKYVNLTVISLEENTFTALKSGRKAPVTIPYNHVLAVSYARGDNGDTSKEIFNTQ